MQTDEELIGEIRRGNQSALEVLIKRHYKMVFAYAYRNVGDYHTAYDLTQEALLKLVRAIHTLQQGESFKPWLLRIAINTCRDYLRSRNYKAGKQSAPYREELDGSGTTGQVVHLSDRQADREEIMDAMMELPTFQRETILLRFYHDLKIKDIARMTAVSEPTVKSRLKQGLAKLRKRLERSEERAKKQDKR